MQAEKALNTRSAYASGWKAFLAWCAAAQCAPLPASPESVRDFVTWCIMQHYRMSTIMIRVCAIAHYHERAGLPSPYDDTTRKYVSNARRQAREQPAGKLALTYRMLQRIAPLFPDTPTGVRNRAMIFLGFAAGWRRSEIVALRSSDVHFLPQGLALWQRYSKTDQKGEGRLVGIEPGSRELTCPVRALAAWLQLRGDFEGPLFVRMTNRQRVTREALEPRGEILHLALKKLIAQIGENAAEFGAHSLRAGMITEAAKSGASEAAIKQRTGHRCSKTLQRYIRPANIFDFNPMRNVL